MPKILLKNISSNLWTTVYLENNGKFAEKSRCKARHGWKKKLLKLTSKPTYVSSNIFNENLVAVHKIKEALTLNKPAYVGMCILDLSKTLMYDFHYNNIKQKYNDKAKLLFTDTAQTL